MEGTKQFTPRAYSPLKSPTLQRHLRENVNISYPKQFLSTHHTPSTKQLLIGNDGFFRSAVDVHDYAHEEIKVSIAGHVLTVSASHQEKEDEFGLITRNFSKKYILPPGLDVAKVDALISKGVLYVKIPPKAEELSERFVDIKIQDK